MDAYTTAQTQDEQRTARLFLSAVGSYFGVSDQTTASQDGYAYSLPRQFQTIGPNGTAVEGYPVSSAQNGALVVQPSILWLVAGAAAVYFLAR